MSSPPSGSPLDTSSPATRVNDNDGRAVAHGSAYAHKILEHAPPSEPIPSSSLGVADSLERPTNVPSRNHDVAPGAFPVAPPSRNTPSRRTFRSLLSSYVSTREFTNNSYTGSRTSGLYAVEAQLVPDENEEGTMIVAEAKPLSMKWYQRPLFRWMLAFGLVGGVELPLLMRARTCIWEGWSACEGICDCPYSLARSCAGSYWCTRRARCWHGFVW